MNEFDKMCARETLPEIPASTPPPVEVIDDSVPMTIGDIRPSLREMVREFGELAGSYTRATPGIPPAFETRLRLRLITEEYFELLHAALYGPPKLLEDLHKDIVRIIDRGEVDVELPELVDAMADLDYTVEHMRQAFGVDGQPIAEAVHEANLAKVVARVEKRGDGKILRPDNWTPPDITGELVLQGWKGGE